MSDLLIIVPARGGSKRLPGKNLRALSGRSLLAHTAEAIRAARLDAPVLLTTDDDAIAAEGKRLGWQVPFRRPAELSTDTATTTAAVLHALDWHKVDTGRDPAAIMLLQPTSPLRGSACLTAAVAALASRPRIDSVIAMTALHLPPGRLYAAAADGVVTPLLAGDGRLPLYVPNGALYLTRTVALRRDNSLYAGAILALVLDRDRAVDVDTECDWRIAEAMLARELPLERGSFDPAPTLTGTIE